MAKYTVTQQLCVIYNIIHFNTCKDIYKSWSPYSYDVVHRGERGQLNQIFESCPLLADNSTITSRNLTEFYKLLFAKYFLLKFTHICCWFLGIIFQKKKEFWFNWLHWRGQLNQLSWPDEPVMLLLAHIYKHLNNQCNYEMIIYHYMNGLVLTQVFSLPSPYFPEVCYLHTCKIYRARTDTSVNCDKLTFLCKNTKSLHVCQPCVLEP